VRPPPPQTCEALKHSVLTGQSHHDGYVCSYGEVVMSDTDEMDIRYGVFGSPPFAIGGKWDVSIFTWVRTSGPWYPRYKTRQDYIVRV
jgi:hypothetical protein